MVKRVPPVNSGWPQAPVLFGIGALAILLFVTVFGAANIYIKVLNRVKQR